LYQKEQPDAQAQFERLGICSMKADLHRAMQRAFEEADAAAARGEVPVGACLVGPDGQIIASAGNRMRELNDPTAHAEVLAIRKAGEVLGSERLMGCDLHVTLEPCAMCAAAISFARIGRLYFGAGDEKMGAVENGPCFFAQATCHHAPEVYSGLGEARARDLMTQFFRNRR
jgi:tRNA(Arg) A34 adenosine deaminase TadA